MCPLSKCSRSLAATLFGSGGNAIRHEKYLRKSQKCSLLDFIFAQPSVNNHHLDEIYPPFCIPTTKSHLLHID